MTLSVYECLKAVGLQHHYARFTSVGVCHAAHISGLTIEDYPILGIRSMEDRTRLFHLVQMVKTLDLEIPEYEDGDDDDYDTDSVNKDFAVAESSLTFAGCGDPDEDVNDHEDEKGTAVSKLNAASSSKPFGVRRRLDFSYETIDHEQNLFSHPVGNVHVYTRNDEQSRDKESVIPVRLELGTGSAVVCSCKGNNNNMLDVHSHQADHHKGANTKPDIVERNSIYSSHTRLSPKYVSPHKPEPSPARVASNRFCNKPVGHKDLKRISRKEKLHTERSSNTASEHIATATPVYELRRTAGYNYGLPLSSPPTPNKKKSGGQRISVCVRKRPLTRTECRRGEADVVATPSGECVIVHESKEAVDLTQYILQHRFFFDQVFGEESSNEEVYQSTAYPLVQHMLNGGKATCFAYGQTGAGKTHTMLGSCPRRPGLYALAARDIFAHLSSTHTQSLRLVYVSFFEIYCGQLYDLLDHRKRLFAREDGQKVVHIAGLRDVRVDSVSSLLEVISQGTEERTEGMSGVNPLSSRSHALLQIQLRGPNQQIAGRMSFVDLAGSERASDTKEPDRKGRMEGAEINQSLLALKECIRSLDQEQSHTPFRQSKLTQVLKDSFVGDSMTCMIANISPGHLATEHTLNTLRYADRVKELRGQGGLRGGRSGKTIPSPKRNLCNSTSGGSSVGTRGKSPPKKPKLGRPREAIGPITPTSSLAPVGSILCSTPKNRKSGDETSARARRGIALEQITPIRGLLGTGDNKGKGERGKAGEREGRRREMNRRTDSAGHSIGDQIVGARLVLGQASDVQLNLWGVQRDSRLEQRDKENQQGTLKGGREGERRWTEQGRQMESNRDTCSDVERLKDLQQADERDEEKERHLRRYHQQLQQFMPSSASSSDHLFSPSTCQSFSSSVSPSFSSPLQHSSPISVSALIYSGLDEVLDGYTARVKVKTGGNRGQLSAFPSGEMCLQTETSPSFNRNKDDIGQSDSGGEDWRESLEGTKAELGQDKDKSERRRSLKARGEGEFRVKSEDWRPAGIEEGKRRWAWGAETEQTDRMTGARPADVEALVSYNCDSEVGEEGLDASDVPADGVWRTEEREASDSYGLVSTYSDNDSSSLFNHPPFDSPHQRAPAERPLSPACEQSNTILTPNKLSDLSFKLKHTRGTANILPQPLQSARQGVPSSSCREMEPRFATNAIKGEFSNVQLATLPLTTAVTQNGCKISAKNQAYTQGHNHPEAIAKTAVLAEGETSTDSLSSIMDPLSISLLRVEQRAATASFFQGEQNNKSLCLLENEREDNRREVGTESLTCAEMAGKVADGVNKEFRMSHLKLPAKTLCPSTNPESKLVSLHDQENNQKPQTTAAIELLDNKAPASPLKPSTCASMETSSAWSIASSAHPRNTGSHTSHNLLTNGATQMASEYAHNVNSKLAFSISTPQSEHVLGQLSTLPEQCHTVHLNNFSCSNVTLKPNSSTESNSEERTSYQPIKPRIPLSTLEDLYHGQWRVVQAHWEQLEEMETLCRKEGTLLYQQPDMAFGEYVHKLGEIMERKARCVHSMIAQLQSYVKTSHSNQPPNQGEKSQE